jgi:hypothetical protein
MTDEEILKLAVDDLTKFIINAQGKFEEIDFNIDVILKTLVGITRYLVHKDPNYINIVGTLPPTFGEQ